MAVTSTTNNQLKPSSVPTNFTLPQHSAQDYRKVRKQLHPRSALEPLNANKFKSATHDVQSSYWPLYSNQRSWKNKHRSDEAKTVYSDTADTRQRFSETGLNDENMKKNMFLPFLDHVHHSRQNCQLTNNSLNNEECTNYGTSKPSSRHLDINDGRWTDFTRMFKGEYVNSGE